MRSYSSSDVERYAPYGGPWLDPKEAISGDLAEEALSAAWNTAATHVADDTDAQLPFPNPKPAARWDQPSPQKVALQYLKDLEAADAAAADMMNAEQPSPQAEAAIASHASLAQEPPTCVNTPPQGAIAATTKGRLPSRFSRWLPARAKAKAARAAVDVLDEVRIWRRKLEEGGAFEADFVAAYGRPPTTQEEWGEHWEAFVYFQQAARVAGDTPRPPSGSSDSSSGSPSGARPRVKFAAASEMPRRVDSGHDLTAIEADARTLSPPADSMHELSTGADVQQWQREVQRLERAKSSALMRKDHEQSLHHSWHDVIL